MHRHHITITVPKGLNYKIIFSSVRYFLFQGSKRILGPWHSQNEVPSVQKNNKVRGKAACVSGAAADADSAACASSASSEQNAPLEIPSTAAEKGSCDLMKDGEGGKTENEVIKYNANTNPETQQSDMSWRNAQLFISKTQILWNMYGYCRSWRKTGYLKLSDCLFVTRQRDICRYDS